MRFLKKDTFGGRKGQVSIFVIIAIVAVAAIVLFFLFRGRFFGESVPAEFRPPFEYYQQCI